jgi:hypothetical protein
MNTRKSTLVVEKSTHKILCYNLISKFKHISIELFFIGCKKKKNHTILNKKDIQKVIYQYITQHINPGKSYKETKNLIGEICLEKISNKKHTISNN